MENNQKSSISQAKLTWGLITGLAGIIYTVILYITGLMQNKPVQYAGIIITIVCLYLGIKTIRDQNYNGFISYGKALGTGFLIGLYSTIISMIFMVILYTVIDSGLISIALQDSANQMAERGMSEDQIEQGLAMTRKLFLPFFIIGGLIVGTLASLIISLILSIFLKKEENAITNSSEQ